MASRRCSRRGPSRHPSRPAPSGHQQLASLLAGFAAEIRFLFDGLCRRQQKESALHSLNERARRLLLGGLALILMSACGGGGGSGGGSGGGGGGGTVPTFAIGGTLTGLRGTGLVLRNLADGASAGGTFETLSLSA